jgi:hypothetical protein
LNFTGAYLLDIFVSLGDLNSSGYDRIKVLRMSAITQNLLLSRSVAFIPNIAHVHKLFEGEGMQMVPKIISGSFCSLALAAPLCPEVGHMLPSGG